MRISPKIGNSHLEQMNLIYEFICRFDVNNLLYAINGKQLDEDEIVSLTNDIKEYNAKLLHQSHYLFKFCKKFPKEFASEDNHHVDSSVKISWRMRSGAAGIKKIFKKFCRVSHAKLPTGVPEPQAVNCSLISTKNYMLELFGLSSYPDCVKELFREMFDFYTNMNDCLEEGLRCIKEVNNIRGNAKKCLDILIMSCEKSKKHQQTLLEAIMTDPDMKKAVLNNKILTGEDENPVLMAYKNTTSNKEQFAQRYYKNCSPSDVDKITVYDVTNADEDPYMAFAKVVFGNNPDKIYGINYVIEHFDELLPDKCKRGKIPALNLFFFYEWSKPIVGIDSFLKYFNKYYSEHGGRWSTVAKSAISGAQTKHSMCKDGATQEIKDNMLSKIRGMIDKNFPQLEAI